MHISMVIIRVIRSTHFFSCTYKKCSYSNKYYVDRYTSQCHSDATIINRIIRVSINKCSTWTWTTFHFNTVIIILVISSCHPPAKYVWRDLCAGTIYGLPTTIGLFWIQTHTACDFCTFIEPISWLINHSFLALFRHVRTFTWKMQSMHLASPVFQPFRMPPTFESSTKLLET